MKENSCPQKRLKVDIFFLSPKELFACLLLCLLFLWSWSQRMKNYNSKKEDLEEEDQRQDERNVIL